MILFNEKDNTGAISRVICHYAEANNKNIYGYDKSKICKYFLNLDLTTFADMPHLNRFLMRDLNLLNICQCLHLSLS